MLQVLEQGIYRRVHGRAGGQGTSLRGTGLVHSTSPTRTRTTTATGSDEDDGFFAFDPTFLEACEEQTGKKPDYDEATVQMAFAIFELAIGEEGTQQED